MKRREFLTVPVKSLGGLLLYTIAGEPVRLPAQEMTILKADYPAAPVPGVILGVSGD